jgi:hypothetical protein
MLYIVNHKNVQLVFSNRNQITTVVYIHRQALLYNVNQQIINIHKQLKST